MRRLLFAVLLAVLLPLTARAGGPINPPPPQPVTCGGGNSVTALGYGIPTTCGTALATGTINTGATNQLGIYSASTTISPLTGTSGGIPYFGASSAVSSSAALLANRLVLGGGAGAAPATLGSLGTTTTLLHGNASGAPTFSAVNLAADVSGLLPNANLANASVTIGSTNVVLGATAATVAGLTLTSPTINGATLSGTLAGNATFSGNLTLNGALSGTGVTNVFASPPAIGSGTPGTGAFTTLILSGITTGTQVVCLGLDVGNNVVSNAAACGTGSGGGTPGGTSGQVQYNNSGSFGGFTVGGDATLNTGTGALTVASIGGKSVSLANSLTTSGNFALTLTTTAATNSTLPSGTHTLLAQDLANGNIFIGSAGNVATAQAISQDASLVASGALTVTGIRTHPVTTNSPADTNVLCYVAANSDIEWCAASGGGANIGTGAANDIAYYASAGTSLSALHDSVGAATLIFSSGGVPSISQTLPSQVQGNITSLGTVTGGTWNATVVAGQYGGTGVANTGKTITLGGNLTTTTGALTFAAQAGGSSVTVPSAGTLLVDANLTSGKIFVGSASNLAAAVTPAGDWTISNTGATAVGKVNGVTYPSSPGSTNTVPSVTSTAGGGTVAYQSLTIGSTAMTFGSANTSIAGLTLTASPNLGLRDTSAAFDVTLGATSSTALTASRALTIDVVNGARTLKLGASLTIASDPGGVTGALKSNGSGTFGQAACSDLSNGATGCSTAVGTSGATLPLLNAANTWSGVQSFSSGDLALKGATSGTLTVTVAATAGTNTLTLPGGTTDFSATGGASQVVKQTTAGGAFTVARLSCSDLSDSSTGCSGTAAITQLTGDVTAGPGTGSVAATIAANAVSNAKFRQGVARSVVGVTGNATANVADIQGTANQVLIVNSAGTALAFGQVNLASTAAVTGQLVAGSFPALTGDVTTTGGALATTIAAAAVTSSKLASGAAASNVGTLGGDLSGTLPSPTIAANAVTYAKMQQEAATTFPCNPTATNPANMVACSFGAGFSFSGSTLNFAGTPISLNRITTGSSNTLTTASMTNAFTTEAWKSASGAAKADHVPGCSSQYNGYFLTELDEYGDAGTNGVTVIPDQGTTSTIGPQGTSTFSLTANFEAALFQCDGTTTNWQLVYVSSPGPKVRYNTANSLTITSADNGGVIQQTSATAAIAASIATPTQTTAPNGLMIGGYGVTLQNLSTQLMTLTPQSPTLINGAASAPVPPLSSMIVIADQAGNYAGILVGPGTTFINPGSHTITVAEWASNPAYVAETSGTNITLPASANLPAGSSVPITTIGASSTVTLTPNAVDGFNGGTINTAITVPANLATTLIANGVAGTGAWSIPLGPKAGNNISLTTNSDGTTTVASSIAGGLNVVTFQSGTSYSLASTDCNTTVHFTGTSSAITTTMPDTLPVGCDIAIVQDGTQIVTVAHGTNGILHSHSAPTFKTAAQYAAIGLHVYANSDGSHAIADVIGDGQ